MKYGEKLVNILPVVRRRADGLHTEMEVEVRGRRSLRGITKLSATYRSQPFKLTREERKMARQLLWVAGVPENEWVSGVCDDV